MKTARVTNRNILRMTDLDNLMTRLEVDVVRLTECLVSPGWRLSFPATEMPGLHYNLTGHGHMFVGAASPIQLTPHTLVITPPRQPFRIDVLTRPGRPSPLKVVKGHWRSSDPAGTMQKFVAGDNEPEVIMICGYFRASYGMSIDLFATLQSPVVERFGVADELADKLTSVLAELAAQQLGMRAMTTTLLKQIIVALLRRSLKSSELRSEWERFTILKDPNIARAFADMVTRPGAPHSLQTLSQTAGLSRSVFMTRFMRTVGHSPMVALRQLRMRHAADLLAANTLSIEQVSNAVGFSSRSSFFRAFRRAHGIVPSNYRARASHLSDR